MKRHSMRWIFQAVLALALFSSTAWAAPVVVVLSRTAEPYTAMLEGFKQAFSGEVVVANMEGNAQQGQQLMQGYQPGEVAAVVAVGTEAARAGAALNPAIPLLFSMVREPVALPKRNPAGVILQIKVSDQFGKIALLFPLRKRIGVIYNPSVSADQVSEARGLMDRFGLKLYMLSVESAAGVPAALDRMTPAHVDLIWMVLDETVAQPAVLKQVITHSLQQKLPVVGFSMHQVKAGVVAAFAADYQDIGGQTAKLAKRMIAGEPAAVEAPRKMLLYVNPTVQQALGCEDLTKAKDAHQVQ